MKSNATRQRDLRIRRRKRGLETVKIVVPALWHRPLRDMAQFLRDHPQLDAIEFIPYYRDGAGRIHPMIGGL